MTDQHNREYWAVARGIAQAADAVDLPTWDEAGESDRDWIRKFAPQASLFIAAHDALIEARFGPEHLPAPVADITPKPALTLVSDDQAAETTQAFARRVQAIVTELDHDWIQRDEELANAAVKFAAQFVPGGIAYPTPDQPEQAEL